MRRPTVLIADDHPIVMEGLVSLLKDRFEVVGTVGDGTRLLEEAARLRPDVIVTDDFAGALRVDDATLVRAVATVTTRPLSAPP